jgi:hypothetical protein
MTRLLLPLLVVALVVAGCGSASSFSAKAVGGSPTFAVGPPRPPAPTAYRFSTASNREFARHDVQKLLRIVVVPRSARQVADVPKSAPAWFRGELSAHFEGSAIARRVWVVDQPLEQVVLFIRAHARPRPRPEVPFRKPANRIGSRPSQDYLFHPVPGRSWSRWLNIAMLALPNGSTVVVAQAGDSWLRPPPPSSVLSAKVKRIDISSRLGNARPNVLVHLRKAYDVGSIVAWMNGLGTATQRVTCLGWLRGGPVVTLTFRAADGHVLARARVADPGGSGLSGPCNPVSLSVNGAKAPPLIGADLLHRIEQHLGLDLAPPAPGDVVSCLSRHAGWTVPSAARSPLTVAKGGRRWTITFHSTGKLTTNRPAPPILARCLKSGPRIVILG